MASNNPRRERENDDDEEEKGRKESARKVYERLQSISTAMGTRDAQRIAQRLSRWANPLHMQWSEVNRTVTTEMIKEIWNCAASETSKGRWKIARCNVPAIVQNAEDIAMEVFGHPLHNHDAPLYFAKMLYMQFVLEQPVDFSSKDSPASQSDAKSSQVTLTKQELHLALEGAKLDLMEEKEQLKKSLAEKEQEARRIFETSTPARATQNLSTQIERVQQTMQQLVQSQGAPSHILNCILHPEAVVPSVGASSSTSTQCPSCNKTFDSWSGYYMLACGHFYHLACLIRTMVLGEPCGICRVCIPNALYKMFSLQVPEAPPPPEREASSIMRNLNFDFENQN